MNSFTGIPHAFFGSVFNYFSLYFGNMGTVIFSLNILLFVVVLDRIFFTLGTHRKTLVPESLRRRLQLY